jgi:predicted nucleic acid-binding protein
MTEPVGLGVAVDTNVLVYAEGEGDLPRCALAREVLARLPTADVMLPSQVLGELHRVLTRRSRRSAPQSRDAVLAWADVFRVRDSSWVALQAAMDLHTDHQLQIWDALVLAVAAEQRCRILLSEDFQHGFTWRGVTVVNPFAPQRHALLERAMQG